MGRGKDGLTREERRAGVPPRPPKEESFVVKTEDVPRDTWTTQPALTGLDRLFDIGMFVGIVAQVGALGVFLLLWWLVSAHAGATWAFYAASAGWVLMAAAYVRFRAYRQLGDFLWMGVLLSSGTVGFGIGTYVDPGWAGAFVACAMIVAGLGWLVTHPVSRNT